MQKKIPPRFLEWDFQWGENASQDEMETAKLGFSTRSGGFNNSPEDWGVSCSKIGVKEGQRAVVWDSESSKPEDVQKNDHIAQDRLITSAMTGNFYAMKCLALLVEYGEAEQFRPLLMRLIAKYPHNEV